MWLKTGSAVGIEKQSTRDRISEQNGHRCVSCIRRRWFRDSGAERSTWRQFCWYALISHMSSLLSSRTPRYHMQTDNVPINLIKMQTEFLALQLMNVCSWNEKDHLVSCRLSSMWRHAHHSWTQETMRFTLHRTGLISATLQQANSCSSYAWRKCSHEMINGML